MLAKSATIFIACYALPISVVAASLAFNDVKKNHQPSDTLVVDSHGDVLQRVRTDMSVRKGQWVALGDVSQAFRTALVLSEDKRFYSHSGVDWQAVSAAAWANLWNSKTRGASTITMQLTGLLDEDWRQRSGGRSLFQKLGQTVSAQSLEREWRKDQILEAYLNLVPFRGELVGIDALSRTLFGKAAHGLDMRESAIAAALVRAPNANPSQVAKRACEVLKNLPSSSDDCAGLDMLTSTALQSRDYAPSEGIAPHWAQQVLRKFPKNTPIPHRITTTVRAPLQRYAHQTLQQKLRELSHRHVEDGAIIVLDNASGDVLAWVGSSGELSRASQVDGVLALRQPGSTLKPFLYAQAIAQRRVTAASLLDDSGTQIQTSGGLYIPQNYDHQFKGWVSVRTALAASLNVPAVRTLLMVSPTAFHQQLGQLGLPLKESGDFYGYSLALGSAEVSLQNLTNAYRALANGGRINQKQVIDARAAFIVSDILSDSLARSRTFGSDSLLGTRFWTAVKTGTSKDMRDNWAIGYSSRYTVGVWVGNASGAPMQDVSGTTGAAPIWVDMMNFLHHNPRQLQHSHPPKPPTGMVQMQVQLGTEASRKEWFIQGTEQAQFATYSIATNARITSPTSGSIIAIDPDIPPNRQRLNFTASGTGLRWRMDGKIFASGNTAQWMPWPGKHIVQIVDAKNKVLDEVNVEVRGAGVVKSTSNNK
jgi:penicillin-binding protein 1C